MGILVLANVVVFGLAQMKEKARPLDLSGREMNADALKLLRDQDLSALKSMPERGSALSSIESTPVSTESGSAALSEQNTPNSAQQGANVVENADNRSETVTASPPSSTAQTGVSPEALAAAQAAAQAAAKSANTPPPQKPSESAPKQPEPVQAREQFCFHWGDFDETTAGDAKQRLVRAGLGKLMVEIVKSGEASKPKASGGSKYWVYLPKVGDREASVKRVLALREKGFEAFVVNQHGEFLSAISLGLFSKQASADALVTKLAQAGFAGAKVHLRSDEVVSTSRVSYLRLRDLDDAQRTRLQRLAADAPNTTLKSIPCSK